MRQITREQLRTYLIGVAPAAIAIFTVWYVLPFVGKTFTFLFFICAVTISVGWGGMVAASITTAATTAAAIYFFLLPQSYFSAAFLTALYEIGAFLVAAIFLSSTVETFKKTDLDARYKAKEKIYIGQIRQVSRAHAQALSEIKIRDEFLSIASHELKTPLTTMLLKLQMVLHNIRNVSLANFSVKNLMLMLETAEVQTKRLSRMINDLLNVSLISTGRMNLELEYADLTEIVKEVVAEFTERLQKDGYTLKLIADGEITVVADKVRLAQVVTNLISNAIKYGNKKSITVVVGKTRTQAIIQVKDQGIGIARDKRERIFELFERGVTITEYKGLGVGLYIANKIAAAHQGRIKIESRVGAGSTFTVELPLANQKKS